MSDEVKAATDDQVVACEKIINDRDQGDYLHTQFVRPLIARIRADAAKIEELRKEVRAWICEKCRMAYPGPPAEGVSCVLCRECGGTTMPVTMFERRLAGERAEKAEAKVERLEGALRAFVDEFEIDFVLGNLIVNGPGEMWGPIVPLYEAAREALEHDTPTEEE